MGKLAWPKGLGELFSLMEYVRRRTGKSFPIDVFGQGPHDREIRSFASNAGLPVRIKLMLITYRLHDYVVTRYV